MRRSEAITITATGVNVAAGATSASAAIPNTSAGTKPNYVRVTATGQACVRLGVGSATATVTDALVQPADSVILAVGGNTHIAAIQAGGSAASVNVVPLEDVG
jgi:hypothetical protein